MCEMFTGKKPSIERDLTGFCADLFSGLGTSTRYFQPRGPGCGLNGPQGMCQWGKQGPRRNLDVTRFWSKIGNCPLDKEN